MSSILDLVTNTTTEDEAPAIRVRYFWSKWLLALKQVLPTYLIAHVIFGALSLFSSLFALGDFSVNSLPLHTLLQEWNRWDTGQYTAIAQHGYDGLWRTTFFPLFPLLEKIGAYLAHDPFIAGLIISNTADLIMLVVLYQLVKEDFGDERAANAVLYVSIFPSAFFFLAAYTESLFVCLTLLSFYQIRRGNFWLVGIFGLLASLMRSAGVFLLFPCAYELLRRKQIRFDVLSAFLIPLGLAIYSWYCNVRFKDFLAWEHAQSTWHHQFHFPWDTLFITLRAIKHGPGLLSFQTLHNLLDLASILFVLVMMILLFIGPWRLRREHMVYAVYSVPLFFFLLSVPVIGDPPLLLQSVPRFMLEVFPVFVIAGGLGKHRWFHDSYLLVSGTLLFLSCMLFLTGYWIV